VRRVLDTEDLEDPTDWRRARDHGVCDDDEGDRGRDDDDDDDEDDDESHNTYQESRTTRAIETI